jgi:hypothetical protein
VQNEAVKEEEQLFDYHFKFSWHKAVYKRASEIIRSPFFGVPSMFGNLEVRLRLSWAEVKSSTQPDGGEVLAKRKSAAVRQGFKEACSKAAA